MIDANYSQVPVTSALREQSPDSHLHGPDIGGYAVTFDFDSVRGQHHAVPKHQYQCYGGLECLL